MYCVDDEVGLRVCGESGVDRLVILVDGMYRVGFVCGPVVFVLV